MKIIQSANPCAQWLQDTLRDFRDATGQTGAGEHVHSDQFEQLLAALYGGDLSAAQAICRHYVTLGPAGRSSAMDLIVPAVYHIEKEWLNESRSYGSTLFAFWNLQQLLQRQQSVGLSDSSSGGPPAAPPLPGYRQGTLLMATVPGGAHTFGSLVVSGHFQANGWQVSTALESTRDALLHTVEDHHFDCVGLSLGQDSELEGLPDLLRDLRDASRNAALRVLVGGNIFVMRQSQYDWIGADYLASGAEDAFRYCLSVTQLRPL